MLFFRWNFWCLFIVSICSWYVLETADFLLALSNLSEPTINTLSSWLKVYDFVYINIQKTMESIFPFSNSFKFTIILSSMWSPVVLAFLPERISSDFWTAKSLKGDNSWKCAAIPMKSLPADFFFVSNQHRRHSQPSLQWNAFHRYWIRCRDINVNRLLFIRALLFLFQLVQPIPKSSKPVSETFWLKRICRRVSFYSDSYFPASSICEGFFPCCMGLAGLWSCLPNVKLWSYQLSFRRSAWSQ